MKDHPPQNCRARDRPRTDSHGNPVCDRGEAALVQLHHSPHALDYSDLLPAVLHRTGEHFCFGAG